MKIQMYYNLNMKSAEKMRSLSGSLVMPMNVCCLCCCNDTGGDLFCK
ncbi:MAG: hypothetical protein K2F60_05870 [Oscillospiraceae bacterium]|nr:hypothetical protein [Oscillospiraceae bacterium]